MADKTGDPGVDKNSNTTDDISRDLTKEAIQQFDKITKETGTISQSSGLEQEKSTGGSGRLVRKQDDLLACLTVMRRLMEQAESESKQLKEEKYVIAAKINNSLNSVNREVEHLKAELRDQDRRLAELASERLQENPNAEEPEEHPTVTRTMSNSSEESGDSLKRLEKLGDENQRLRKENDFLTRELNEFRGSNSDLAELYERLHSCEHEISRAKETIVCMKSERKKLKGEKMELLNQMKQVYGILEEKESELREFIKNYEQQMKSSDIKIKQLLSEKEKWIHERKDSLQYIDDLNNKIRTKETHLAVVESELLEVKQRLTLLRVNIPSAQSHHQGHGETNNLNISNSSRFSRAIQADVEKLLHIHATGELDNISKSPYSTAEILPVPTSTPVDSQASDSQSEENQSAALSHGDEVFEDGTPASSSTPTPVRFEKKLKRKDKSRNFGSLSKLFSKGKQRKSSRQTFSGVEYHSADELLDTYTPGTSFSSKQHIYDLNKDVAMSCWKANMVLAWLEVECKMPMYVQMCHDNVKSGRVLLELSDAELESGLGISNAMHRRKLRLAIEDCRNPNSIKFPCISQIDHFWVARTWIRDLGLSQYGPVFESQMIDGRMLNVLTKKDMEKYLNVNKKFHQISILHGVELLRMISFDKKVLLDRRKKCEDNNADSLVWTNEKVIRWCRSIDLGEYAESLRDSGVHGAVMVLEPSFGSEEMAQALAIHSSKNIIRRHLTSEMTALIITARATLNFPIDQAKDKKQRRRRSFSFNVGSRRSTSEDTKRHSFRISWNNTNFANSRTTSSLERPIKPKCESTSALQINQHSNTLQLPTRGGTGSLQRPLRPRSSVH